MESESRNGDLRTTRITILVDNDVEPGFNLRPEHGFAALVERGSERILFDTGQGPALEHNARALGITLSSLSTVILSHGHYDHTGGLFYVVKQNPGIRVVAHPAVFSPHLKSTDSETMFKSIGIPYTRETLESSQAVFRLTPDLDQVSSGVWFTGMVPRVFPSTADARLKTKDSDKACADPLEDDCSLVLETASGPVVLLGCAHAGVRNILEHVRVRLGIGKVHAVIGGTHLGLSDPSETPPAIEAFEQAGVQVLAPTHCTGAGPKALLKAHFGDRYRAAGAGTVFAF